MGKFFLRVRQSVRRLLRRPAAAVSSFSSDEAPVGAPLVVALHPHAEEQHDGKVPSNTTSFQLDHYHNHNPSAGRHRPSPSLETLPAEIQLQILSDLSNLEDLQSITWASPIFWTLYKSSPSRGPLLWNLLRQSIGSDEVLVDAWAAYVSGPEGKHLPSKRRKRDIMEFMDGYQELRLLAVESGGGNGNAGGQRGIGEREQVGEASNSLPKKYPPTTEEIVKMTAFYTNVARPLVKMYIQWTLYYLASVTTTHNNTTTGTTPPSQQLSSTLSGSPAPTPNPIRNRNPSPNSALSALSAPLVLSPVERIRIFRALYRYQLFTNLFSKRKGLSPPPTSYEGSAQARFLELFEPWEVEEITCVNMFVYDVYHRVFEAVKWDFHPYNPRFDDKRCACMDPLGSFRWEEQNRLDIVTQLSSQGLTLLHSTLHLSSPSLLTTPVPVPNANSTNPFPEPQPDPYHTPYHRTSIDLPCPSIPIPPNPNPNHASLISLLSACIPEGDSTSYMTSPTEYVTRHAYLMPYSERDRMEQNRQIMSFTPPRHSSDGDTGVVKAVGPPLAWVIIWKGRYANMFGDFIPDSLRRWGYVMWDPRRLLRSGGKKILLREWEEEYGGQNPRD